MINKYIDYYKATFKGEIFEKVKRKLLIKMNIFEKKKELKEVELELCCNFKKNNFRKKIGENRFRIFNKYLNIENLNWKDFKNGKKWYLENLKDYGDIKEIWEINRLQFLPLLILNNKEELAKNILNEWIEKNPYNIGINWNNNLEVAIRGISLINFYILLKDKNLNYEKLIYLHGLHIYNDIKYSEKCIPNNHVIGEAATLYCISKFLKFSENKKWEEKAKRILKTYSNHLHIDGTYEEASLSYHRFVLQMYIMVFLFSKKSNDNFLEDEILEKLKRATIFLKSIEKPNKNYPDFGDNDEGMFYKLDYNMAFYNFVESLNSLFEKEKKGEIKLLEEIYDIKLNNKEEYEKIDKQNIFNIGKYFVYRQKENYFFIHNQKQIYHSHSDGMAMELMLNGKEILIDSGTYNYNIDINKRKYYRGTLSHNTVYLNEDQSKQIGSFRWINSSQNLFETKEELDNFFIKGSNILKNKKEHIRKINLEKDFKKIEVKDIIKNTDKFIISWIFSSEIKTINKISEKEISLNNNEIVLNIETKDKIEVNIVDAYISLGYNQEILVKKLEIKNIENKKEYIITSIFKIGEI
ncbi:heparinase II/III domain-containing protein [Fusobacterium perfoetens]|uniref:heparinase II/III domain-containing protein n=1 Tax=Fusobacterium perfoetens TaxID=852 RepID=UPI000488163F|nr:heparinase II/III family protein [Fusobacterium perfoetens]